MNKVYKQSGRFFIEPDEVYLARAQRKEDQVKVKAKLTDEELRALIERILIRLEALEKVGNKGW